MGKGSGKIRKGEAARPPRDGGSAGAGPNLAQRERRRSRWHDARYVLVFLVWLLGLYGLSTRNTFQQKIFPKYLSLNAFAAGKILNVLGQNVAVRDKTIRSNERPFSIEIARGCDAVEPAMLFCAAVMASPVPVLQRILAAIGGTVVLMILNFVRVVSLFLVGIYWNAAFDTMHLDVWQVVFIFLAALLFVLWATKMVRRARKAHVAA